MEYEVTKIKAHGRQEVCLLGSTFEKGKPEEKNAGHWRHKLEDRQQKLKYLQSAERYWFSTDWFGSEKRKNPA